ncbi:MAG: hypothetical protein WBW35_19920 [Xanthobacteraceae bacterium]
MPTLRADSFHGAGHSVGADAPSDKLRQSARCTGCGGKGATLKHPTWGGNSIGFMPFPTDG